MRSRDDFSIKCDFYQFSPGAAGWECIPPVKQWAGELQLREAGIRKNEQDLRLKTYQRSRGEAFDLHTCEDVCSVLMPLSVGAARVTRNGGRLFNGILRPGMLRLSAPGERSQVVFAAPTRQLELTVPSDSIRRAFREAGYLWPAAPIRFSPMVRPHPMVATLAAALAASDEVSPPHREDYLGGLTQALLACLVDSRHFQLPPSDRSPVRPLDDHAFARCQDFADAKLGAKLSLREWASSLGMSSSEFARAFRRRTGQSPYAWFVDRRIEYAKQLLRMPSHSLADIALSAGFCSQSHFTASFHQRVGCSPARWVLSQAEAPHHR
jgi:AraC family transcriptional regulator